MHVDALAPVWLLHVAAALWRAAQAVSPTPSVPDRVRALAGSCVVIPCSFTPVSPHPLRGRKERMEVRLRFRGGGRFFPLRSTAFNSQDRDQVSWDFRGRTSLFGRVADGDCSVKIEGVRQDDPQVFEVALKAGDDLLWGKAQSFHLDVIDTPEAPVISGLMSATEGQRVTLNCSVSYHCPSRPPDLQWRLERGILPNGSESAHALTLHPDPQKQTLLASLSFTVSHRAKPRLKCEVSYPGARALTTSKDLHVTFSPKDVRVQLESSGVQEGANALLMCSCKADPPVSEYRWSYTQHGHTVHLHQRTHTVRLYNVTRDMRVRCSAQNPLGRGESGPTALNIQYKPLILQLSSSCTLEAFQVSCRCSVDSNPKAAVTWSLNGTVPPPDYNVSVTSEPGVLTATLSGRMDAPQRVVCFAFNAVGNDSLALLKGPEDTESLPLLRVLLPAAAIGLLVLLSSLLVCCCRRRAGKHVLNRKPAVYPEGTQVYKDRMPLYINCTEVTHVYTNGSYQLVYQNCTPLFVHTKQMRPMGRRGGERRRGREGGAMDRRPGLGVRTTGELQGAALADADTAIYLEIL